MLATAFRYVRPSDVETPIHAALNKARADKAATYKRLKEIRRQVEEAGVYGGGLRLEMIRASHAHSEAIWLEKACKTAIEKRANELGLTTVRGKAV